MEFVCLPQNHANFTNRSHELPTPTGFSGLDFYQIEKKLWRFLHAPHLGQSGQKCVKNDTALQLKFI